MMTTVSIIGGGSWGTALALCAQWANSSVMLWMRNQDDCDHMQKTRINDRYLPEIELPKALTLTTDFERAAQSNVILLATPAQTIRKTLETLKTHLRNDAHIVICSKGIELETGLLMHEVAKEVLPERSIAILSGPTFARDVAKGFPITASVAASNLLTSQSLCQTLSSTTFRLYPTEDLVGVCVAGSLKNVIAIASGIAHGRGLGESSRASLITRGLAEITRLGKVMGARNDTFLTPAGIGDLILSCTSLQSRNMHLGKMIGESLIPFSKMSYHALSEGVYTTRALQILSKRLNVDMPISEAVFNILYKDADVGHEISRLLARPLKKTSD